VVGGVWRDCCWWWCGGAAGGLYLSHVCLHSFSSLTLEDLAKRALCACLPVCVVRLHTTRHDTHTPGLWRGSTVAVKTMILPARMSGAEKRERMAIMEAAISSSMMHPNIGALLVVVVVVVVVVVCVMCCCCVCCYGVLCAVFTHAAVVSLRSCTRRLCVLLPTTPSSFVAFPRSSLAACLFTVQTYTYTIQRATSAAASKGNLPSHE
jgi:hypothetical protein